MAVHQAVGDAFERTGIEPLGLTGSADDTTVDPEPFIAWDTRHDRWVADVDAFDGDVSNTPDRQYARIFTGSTWRDFFDRSRFRVVDPDTESPSFDDPGDEPRRR